MKTIIAEKKRRDISLRERILRVLVSQPDLSASAPLLSELLYGNRKRIGNFYDAINELKKSALVKRRTCSESCDEYHSCQGLNRRKRGRPSSKDFKKPLKRTGKISDCITIPQNLETLRKIVEKYPEVIPKLQENVLVLNMICEAYSLKARLAEDLKSYFINSYTFAKLFLTFKPEELIKSICYLWVEPEMYAKSETKTNGIRAYKLDFFATFQKDGTGLLQKLFKHCEHQDILNGHSILPCDESFRRLNLII